MNYLLFPEIISITINGEPFNVVKKIIDDYFAIGSDKFIDRYNFELEELTISPGKLIEEVLEFLMTYKSLGRMNTPLSNDATRFIDKYIINDDVLREISVAKLRNFVNNVISKANDPSEEIKNIFKCVDYMVFHSSSGNGDDNGSGSDDDNDDDNGSINDLIKKRAEDLLKYLEALYITDNIYHCKIQPNCCIKYIGYVLYRVDTSTYHKWMTMSSFKLAILLDDNLYNKILEVVADDFGVKN